MQPKLGENNWLSHAGYDYHIGSSFECTLQNKDIER